MASHLSKDEERMRWLAFVAGGALLATLVLPLLRIGESFSVTYLELVKGVLRIREMGNVFPLESPMSSIEAMSSLPFLIIVLGVLMLGSAVGLIFGAYDHGGEHADERTFFFLPVLFWTAPVIFCAGLLGIRVLHIPDGFFLEFLREGFPSAYPGMLTFVIATVASVLGILCGERAARNMANGED